MSIWDTIGELARWVTLLVCTLAGLVWVAAIFWDAVTP